MTTKGEFADYMRKQLNERFSDDGIIFNKKDCSDILDIFCSGILNALRDSGAVKLPNVGTFKVVRRRGTHPITHEPLVGNSLSFEKSTHLRNAVREYQYGGDDSDG